MTISRSVAKGGWGRGGLGRGILGASTLALALGLVAPVGAADGQLTHIFRGIEEVHVVNVDVVVTDRAGRPVKGLTAADFELFEQGRQVPISNFYAVENGEPVAAAEAVPGQGAAEAARQPATGASAQTAATAPESLQLIVFVDNVNLSPIHRSRVLERVREHLERRWRPGWRVSLMSNDRAVTVRQEPTGQRQVLLAALDELEQAGSRSARLDRELSNLLRAIERVNVNAGIPSVATKEGLGDFTSFNAASPPGEDDDSRTDLTQEEVTARLAAEAVALIPQLTAYAQARMDEVRFSLGVLREMVSAVAGLPGRKAVLYVSDGLSVNPAEAVFDAFDQRFSVLGAVAARYSMRSETARYDLTPAIDELVGTANAARVTFYTIDASPPSAIQRGGADQESNFVGRDLAATEERNEQESLARMAQATGGRVALATSRLDSALEGFLGDLSNYYSLGYVAEPREGRRSLEVRLASGGRRIEVRHRASVEDRGEDQRLAERTLSALLLDSFDNPLGIALEAAEMRPAEDGNVTVPVIVRIPLGKLVLVPGMREHQAKVAMFIAVLDERGRTSGVIKRMCPVRVPNTELLTALGRQAACGMRLLMRPGEQRVAVSVHDEIAAVGSTAQLRIEVVAPASGPEGP